MDEDLENLPIDPPVSLLTWKPCGMLQVYGILTGLTLVLSNITIKVAPEANTMPGRSQKDIKKNDQKPPPPPTVPQAQPQMPDAPSTTAASSGHDATPGAGSQLQRRTQQPPSTQSRIMTLGPLDSMGIPDEVFLADKSEADQCLITITGAYIRVIMYFAPFNAGKHRQFRT